MVLFYWNVLISFDFFLNLHHLYLLLRNNLLVVLNPMLNRVVLSLDNLLRDGLHYSTLFQSGLFLLNWHPFHILAVLILDNFLLIRDIVDSALT